MAVRIHTLIVLVTVLAAIFGLAGWGHLTGLDPGILDAVRAVASAVGAIVLAVLGALVRRDDDQDGIPDILQAPSIPRPAPPILPVLFLALVAGCGPNAAVREGYTVEVARCIANERTIVLRGGTTLDQDQADLAIERARCDSALDALED